jgi:predicted esterase
MICVLGCGSPDANKSVDRSVTGAATAGSPNTGANSMTSAGGATGGTAGSSANASPVEANSGRGSTNTAGSASLPNRPAGAGGASGAPSMVGSVGGIGGSGDAGAGAAGHATGTAGSFGAAGMAGGSPSGGSKPSPGCSKGSARPANGTVTVAGAYYLAFPSTYDGKTPIPVLLGFHGCGSGNRGTSLDSTEWMKLTKGTSFDGEYLRAVPISSDSGGCWSYNADMSRTTTMFDDIVNNYCVDEAKIFATGHSSGAQFIVQQIVGRKAEAQHFSLRGLAPVAADPATIASPVPVMYIDGKMDNQRSATSAANTVKAFRASNGCMETSKVYAPVASCKSSEGGVTVDPGCIVYDGCSVPTIWCSHNDPSYSGTQHGVPCFALKGMYDFFKTLF